MDEEQHIIGYEQSNGLILVIHIIILHYLNIYFLKKIIKSDISKPTNDFFQGSGEKNDWDLLVSAFQGSNQLGEGLGSCLG